MRMNGYGIGLGLLLGTVLVVGCERPATEELAAEGEAVDLTGTWRAVLESPGGELPFTLRIAEGDDGALAATVLNGEEEAPTSGVEIGDEVLIAFDWYDSEIEAEVVDGGDALRGRWRKTAPGGDSTLPFRAVRGDTRRFLPVENEAPAGAPSSVDGVWTVEFRDGDATEPARGELRQEDERVEGTFLTPTGDYRFLAGSYQGGRLRLSAFDGAHAFLFDARAQADGTLEGDFWSRDSYHATWTARPLTADEEVLPDPWSLARLTNDEGRFRFDFEDLEGERVGSDDPRFDGKVVLVNIFGSWCPNCNDEAPLLADWYRRYRDRGLEIVGLAYEFTGDVDRDREQVRKFARRYGIDYPLLVAGTSDKADAAATLPDLDRVVSYPTSIFIGRDGKVRGIHSGFAGPGTGEHYQELVAELEAMIEKLLAEPA